MGKYTNKLYYLNFLKNPGPEDQAFGLLSPRGEGETNRKLMNSILFTAVASLRFTVVKRIRLVKFGNLEGGLPIYFGLFPSMQTDLLPDGFF